MNVKIKFCNFILWLPFLLVLTTFSRAHAFEMSCGLYEVIGRFDPGKRELHVYEKTNAHKIIKLFGKKLLTEFPGSNPEYYRMQVEVHRKIDNGNGMARLVEVIGLTDYQPKELQFTLKKSTRCR